MTVQKKWCAEKISTGYECIILDGICKWFVENLNLLNGPNRLFKRLLEKCL